MYIASMDLYYSTFHSAFLLILQIWKNLVLGRSELLAAVPPIRLPRILLECSHVRLGYHPGYLHTLSSLSTHDDCPFVVDTHYFG